MISKTGPTGITPKLLVVLALLSALAPFATDLYLPAFPEMTVDLATAATQVQLTLTSFLVGIALGQLVFGPISDRFGRLWPLVIGAGLCVVASAAAALAPTVAVLVAARFLQGLTGAAGMVIGRAIISDLARGPAAARAFSLMMIVGGIAPVVAPVIGSILVGVIGWRGIFWVVFAIAAAMLVSIVAVVRETNTAQRRAEIVERHREAATQPASFLSREYLGNTLAFAFAFGVMMAYISASPFVYQVMIGMGAVQYGLLFALNALALAVVSGLSAKLISRHPVRRLLGTGLVLVFASTVALVLLVVLDAPVGWLPVPMFCAVASLGLVFGNATSLALAAVPHRAGFGSALLGALQFALAAAVSPLVSMGGEHTALPLAIVMIVLAAVAMVAFGASRPQPMRPTVTLMEATAVGESDELASSVR